MGPAEAVSSPLPCQLHAAIAVALRTRLYELPPPANITHLGAGKRPCTAQTYLGPTSGPTCIRRRGERQGTLKAPNVECPAGPARPRSIHILRDMPDSLVWVAR